ncbi:Ephrin type-A receptor 8 [Takifugu flavidus]|uniref:Ephrin type-A receptor 8 n=1 Tax=Takifugu flavidus TaxID=433684 RepID=A0A5C6N3J9_9TELE|nr:Ephrin type-A receptor 8 [Takifugu flavidus]
MKVIKACEVGFYKPIAGDGLCGKCPQHSHSETRAALSCPCDSSYYRAADDPPAAPCSRPPSAPVNVISSVNGTSVHLEWDRPLDTGGRSDLQYSIMCQKCSGEGGPCESCDSHPGVASGGKTGASVAAGSGGLVERSGTVAIRFIPRQSGLTEPWVTVLNLVAHSNYSFRILATNAVTLQSNEPSLYAIANITTNQAAPSEVLAVRQENASQNSVTLQWHEPDQPNGVILEYDIKYYEKDNEEHIYSTLKSKNTTARVLGLKPGTKYIFQVRARTSAGCGRFSQNVEIQTGKAAPKRYSTMSIVWICLALLAGLFTFLAIIICRKRQGYTLPHYPSLLHCGYSKAFQDSDEEKMHYQNGHVSFPDARFYIDPHTYEDPCQAVHEFAREIEASRIKIEKIIGSGKPVMIITEYMENGSLDSFLRMILEGARHSSCFLLSFPYFLSASTPSSSKLSHLLYPIEVIKSVEEGYRLPAPMGCPAALHTLMLDCWQKDRNERPRFCQIVTVLDKLIRNPENLKSMDTLRSLNSPPLMERAMPDLSSCNSVNEWLDTIKMSRYKDHFAAGGYHTLGHVIGMNQGDIQRLGVTLMGHQKKIMTSVQMMRAQVLNKSVPTGQLDEHTRADGRLLVKEDDAHEQPENGAPVGSSETGLTPVARSSPRRRRPISPKAINTNTRHNPPLSTRDE